MCPPPLMDQFCAMEDQSGVLCVQVQSGQVMNVLLCYVFEADVPAIGLLTADRTLGRESLASLGSMLELNMQAFCCPPYGQPNDQRVGRPGSCTVARRAARVTTCGC